MSLTGRDAPITPRRGGTEEGLFGVPVLVSWHPSYILRLPEPALKLSREGELIADLQKAAAFADAN